MVSFYQTGAMKNTGNKTTTTLARANPLIDTREGIFDPTQEGNGDLLTIIEESTGRIQGGVRKRIQQVFSPFEQFTQGIRVYSPMQLRTEEIEYIASSWKEREHVKSCILSELALEVLENNNLLNNLEKRIEIDIGTPEGVAYIIKECAGLVNQAKTEHVVVVIHGIEKAFCEGNNVEQSFHLQGALRLLEDDLGHPSIMLGVVSKGAHIPQPMIDRNSPFGLSIEKRYFTSPIGGTEIDMTEVLSADIESAFSEIRKPLKSMEDVYKDKRKELYRSVIEKIISGQNVIYVSLRRGGKTSLRHIAEDTWRQMSAKVEHMPFNKKIHWNNIARIAIRYLFPDLNEDEMEEWCAMEPEQCAEQMYRLWNKNEHGKTPENREKRLLMTGDETWDRELCMEGEDAITKCLTFYKAASEKGLPIQFLELMTDVHYEKWRDTTKDDNVRLSAFELVEGYIIDENEAIAYTEFLIKSFSMNMDATASHRLAEFIVDVCGESIVTLQKCMYTMAISIKRGQSFEDALYGALARLTQRDSDDPHGTWLSYMKQEERILISCMALSGTHTAMFTNEPHTLQSIENLAKKGFITYEIEDGKIRATIALKLILVLTRNYLGQMYSDYKVKEKASAKDLQTATLEGIISINDHPIFREVDERLERT